MGYHGHTARNKDQRFQAVPLLPSRIVPARHGQAVIQEYRLSGAADHHGSEVNKEVEKQDRRSIRARVADRRTFCARSQPRDTKRRDPQVQRTQRGQQDTPRLAVPPRSLALLGAAVPEGRPPCAARRQLLHGHCRRTLRAELVRRAQAVRQGVQGGVRKSGGGSDVRQPRSLAEVVQRGRDEQSEIRSRRGELFCGAMHARHGSRGVLSNAAELSHRLGVCLQT